MKIWIFSDIHLGLNDAKQGFIPFPVVEDADLLIVAGDVSDSIINSVEWIKKISKKVKTIFVPGNHEYYDLSIENTLKYIEENRIGENYFILNNDSVIIDNVKFIGSTLWTDFKVLAKDEYEKIVCQSACMNYVPDFSDFIYMHEPKNNIIPPFFRPKDAEYLHYLSKEYILNELNKDFSGKKVLITHHALHKKSIDKRFKDDLSTSAYVSDLSEIFSMENKPNLVIHGHTHTTFRYLVNDVPVICNPMGFGIFSKLDFKYDYVYKGI